MAQLWGEGFEKKELLLVVASRRQVYSVHFFDGVFLFVQLMVGLGPALDTGPLAG